MAQPNSYLLDSRQVAELLGGQREDGTPRLSPEAAAKLMDRWEVPSVDLGAGRGLGRRWRRELVQEAIEERERDPKDKGKPKARARKPAPLAMLSMDAAELAHALTRAGYVHSTSKE